MHVVLCMHGTIMSIHMYVYGYMYMYACIHGFICVYVCMYMDVYLYNINFLSMLCVWYFIVVHYFCIYLNMFT